jgi:hypothetical protein
MATMELASIPRELPQFGRHLSSLARPASEVFGQQGARKGRGSCGCGDGNGSCGCGGGNGSCGCGGGQDVADSTMPPCTTEWGGSGINELPRIPKRPRPTRRPAPTQPPLGGECCCVSSVCVELLEDRQTDDGKRSCPVKVTAKHRRLPSEQDDPTCRIGVKEYDAGLVKATTGRPPGGYPEIQPWELYDFRIHSRYNEAMALWRQTQPTADGGLASEVADGIHVPAGLEFIQMFEVGSTCHGREECVKCCIGTHIQIKIDKCVVRAFGFCGPSNTKCPNYKTKKPEGSDIEEFEGRISPGDAFRIYRPMLFQFVHGPFGIRIVSTPKRSDQDLPVGKSVCFP